MLLPNACRHPNRNGCFFWRPFEAKRCNNIELGEGGMQVSSQWVWQDGCFFWRTRTQSGKDFLVYGCANTSLNKLPFALATTSIQTRSHLQSCYPANKEAQYFFVYGCANASLNKFPFARATTPIQRHVHLHSCYPQTKNVPPSLQKQNCTNCVLHSARTVHAQCTVQCMPHSARPQNAVNTMGLAFCWQFTKNYRNIFFFCVFWLFLGKDVVFTAFCGRALWRAL